MPHLGVDPIVAAAQLNRKTGHRVHREFVDAETGERVEAKEQVKGYETGLEDYIAFEPEEIANAVPEADKTLDVEVFVPCGQVDDVYFDRPITSRRARRPGPKPLR
jgi:DNA end-binding protein Ku